MQTEIFDPLVVNGRREWLNAQLRISARERERLESELGLVYTPPSAAQLEAWAAVKANENPEQKSQRQRLTEAFGRCAERTVFPDPLHPGAWLLVGRCHDLVAAGAPFSAFYRIQNQGEWRK
jgi:hypothetical protein